jgi:hypothetical protein
MDKFNESDTKLSRGSCAVINAAITSRHNDLLNWIEEYMYKSPLRTGIRPTESDRHVVDIWRKEVSELENASNELHTICEM